MISVIVCTYDRSSILQDALESLATMHVPREFDWELIVVDNNSTDRTREVVEEFARRAPMAVRYLMEENQGISPARNHGIQHARGEIVAFTDDDVALDTDWLLRIGEAFDLYGCMAVGGKIIAVWPGPKPEWFSDEEPFDMSGPIVNFDLGDLPCETWREPFGANMAFRKEAFTKYGLFRADLGKKNNQLLGGEESEFFRRLQNGGEKIVYEPSAVVFHPVVKERTQRRYFQSWRFHWGRALAHIEDPGEDVVRFLGVPRYLLRKLGARFMQWVITCEQKGRFFYKLEVCELAGRIAENFKLSRGGTHRQGTLGADWGNRA